VAPRQQQLAGQHESAARPGDPVEAPAPDAFSPEPLALESDDERVEALLLGLEPTSRRARRRRRG
jgi:hypothetical protein